MLLSKIGKQFACPVGFAGKAVTKAMNLGNQALYHTVIEALPQNKTKYILDIGYGNGYLLRKCLKKGYQNLYGLEVSETMHSLLQEKVGNRCQLSLDRVERMPYKKEMFDSVYTINTIYFWESLSVGFQEIKRVCKPDAIFIIGFYEKKLLSKLPYIKKQFKLYDEHSIQKALNEQGFIVQRIVKKRANMAISYICKRRKD